METVFCCPECGRLREDQFELYQPELFNTHSLRLGPWCVECGHRAVVTIDAKNQEYERQRRAPLLLISGSCASGKSTISHLLAERHGCVQIDGDWMLNLRKAEIGQPAAYTEINEEMLTIAGGLTALGKPVVIAQVILPAQMATYEHFCNHHGIPWQAAVLMPREDVLLERNRTRVCWPKMTPEYWVKHFYTELQSNAPSFKRWYHDNSHESADETAEKLWQRLVGATTPHGS